MAQFGKAAVDRLELKEFDLFLCLGNILGHVKLLRSGQIDNPQLNK